MLFFLFLFVFVPCPPIGTGIGRKNMCAFQAFVALVFVCLIFDIVLLTNAKL